MYLCMYKCLLCIDCFVVELILPYFSVSVFFVSICCIYGLVKENQQKFRAFGKKKEYKKCGDYHSIWRQLNMTIINSNIINIYTNTPTISTHIHTDINNNNAQCDSN